MKFLATMTIGALFVLATAFIVLLYWLMMILFRAMYVLTLPLHFIWRSIRA